MFSKVNILHFKNIGPTGHKILNTFCHLFSTLQPRYNTHSGAKQNENYNEMILNLKMSLQNAEKG